MKLYTSVLAGSLCCFAAAALAESPSGDSIVSAPASQGCSQEAIGLSEAPGTHNAVYVPGTAPARASLARMSATGIIWEHGHADAAPRIASDHRQALAEFDTEAKMSADPQVRAIATAPDGQATDLRMESHLSMARR